MQNRNISVSIDTGTIWKTLVILGVLYLLYVLRDLALVILTAVVIAAAIEPATRFFVKYKIPRVLSVILVYLFLLSSFVGVIYAFIPPLLQEVSKVIVTVPEYIDSFSFLNSPNDVVSLNTDSARGIVDNIGETIAVTDSLSDSVSTLRETLGKFSKGALQTISAVFGGVFSFLIIIVISFYLAVQENGVANFLKIVVPTRHEAYILDLWVRSQDKIGKWMQGQLLLGLLIGVLVYLGLTILGVPYALTLALFAAIAELIPVFGPIIAAVPAVFLGFADSLPLGLMVIGFYVIIQQFENHLIYPLVVRKVVGVPPLVVIVSLIVGAKLAGFLGILLAVPLAAILIEYADDVQKDKAKEVAEAQG